MFEPGFEVRGRIDMRRTWTFVRFDLVVDGQTLYGTDVPVYDSQFWQAFRSFVRAAGVHRAWRPR